VPTRLYPRITRYADALLLASTGVLSVLAINLPNRPWWIHLAGYVALFSLIVKAWSMAMTPVPGRPVPGQPWGRRKEDRL
jgi:uncharacterized membrane protein YecN with MAPEG domain